MAAPPEAPQPSPRTSPSLADPWEFLARLADGRSLEESQAYEAVSGILTEGWSDADVAAFLSFLRLKGPTADELVGAARSLLDNAVSVDPPNGPLLDTCGTGGDRSGTFNVSTATAIVVSACGVKVAKHGNRSVSSRSGSADVLQELGVNVDCPPDVARRCVDQIGIGFFFAPRWHPAVAKIQHVRRALKFSTIFNLLGTLANPLRPSLRMIGVGGVDWQSPFLAQMAKAVQRLGVHSATLVAGEDGLDEVTLAGSTRAIRVTPTQIRDDVWTPDDFGLAPCSMETCKIGSAAESATVIRRIIANEQGPAFNLTMANVACALLTAGSATSLRDGVALAKSAIARGDAAKKLDALVHLTNSCATDLPW
jgi:anthranilate phosphoribosyltransferase